MSALMNRSNRDLGALWDPSVNRLERHEVARVKYRKLKDADIERIAKNIGNMLEWNESQITKESGAL
jgi:hypothetical protein